MRAILNFIQKIIKKWIKKSSFYTKIGQFIQKKHKPCDDAVLNIKNVYIFLNKQGILFVLLLLITFVLGVNYANNLVLGLCFYLFATWIVSVFYTFIQVANLQIKLLDTSLVQAGDTSEVLIEISNNSSRPHYQILLYFETHQKNQSSQLISYLDKSMTVSIPVMTKQRGKMQLPRLVIKSTYPFGVLQAWSYIYFATPVYAYPKPSAISVEQVQQFLVSDENQQNTASGQEDFSHLTDYIEGENLSRVSWVHFARNSQMLTKNFSEQKDVNIHLDYEQMPAKEHEDKLSQLSFLVLEMAKSQKSFSLTLPNQNAQNNQVGTGEQFVLQSLLRLAMEPKTILKL